MTMVCVAIYAVLVAGIQFSDNLSSSLFGVMAYTVILCFSLLETDSLTNAYLMHIKKKGSETHGVCECAERFNESKE